MKISHSNYKCSVCEDTGWLVTEAGASKRCECAIREIVERQWKSFGIDPSNVKKINEYIASSDIQKLAKKIAVQYVKEFEEIKNTEENSMALLGQSGAGKTHLIIAIGAALLDKGFKVTYMPYIEVMAQLKANVLDEESYTKIIAKYQRADLLILDDLFKDKLKNGELDKKLNEADIKHLYAIINYRYINKLPTIVSSEANPNILIELDTAIAGRLLESVGDRIVIFSGQEHNYRLRKWRK